MSARAVRKPKLLERHDRLTLFSLSLPLRLQPKLKTFLLSPGGWPEGPGCWAKAQQKHYNPIASFLLCPKLVPGVLETKHSQIFKVGSLFHGMGCECM